MDIILIICAVGYFLYHYFNEHVDYGPTPEQKKNAEIYRGAMENLKKSSSHHNDKM